MKTHNFTAPADHDDYYHMSLQALYAIQNDEGIEHPRQVLQEVHNLNALEDCSMIVAQNPEAFSRNVFFDLLLDPFRSAAGGERIMSEEERQQEWEEYLHDTHPDDFENHHSSAWTEIFPRVLLLGIRRRGGPGKSRRVTVLCSARDGQVVREGARGAGPTAQEGVHGGVRRRPGAVPSSTTHKAPPQHNKQTQAQSQKRGTQNIENTSPKIAF